MGTIAFNFPFLSILTFGMGCVGFYSVDVLRSILRYLANGCIVEGLWLTLALGFAVALVLAGYRVIDTTLDRLLSNSLIYFGAFVCCWLSHFGAPFMGRVPVSFSFRSDFVMLFLIAFGLMGLHVGVGYVMRRLDRHA